MSTFGKGQDEGTVDPPFLVDLINEARVAPKPITSVNFPVEPIRAFKYGGGRSCCQEIRPYDQ